jgi:hypothetical protein
LNYLSFFYNQVVWQMIIKTTIVNAVNNILFFIVSLSLLAACGGGGSGSPATQNNNTGNTPTGLLVMDHEITFDPVSDTLPPAQGEQVNTVFGGTHENVQMAFTSNGYGMAIWQTASAGSEKAVYSSYDPLAGQWSVEQTLFVVAEVSSPPATQLSLVASASGFAVSWRVSQVYEGHTSSGTGIWNDYNYVKVYENGEWSAAMQLNALSDASYVSSPKITSNGTGFMLAWQEDANIFTRELTGTGLSDPMDAYYLSTTHVEDMEITSNGSGYALKLEHGTTPGSFTSRFMAAVHYQAGSWSTPVTTETTPGAISHSKIATDGSGYMMIWIQDGVAQYSLYSGGNWSSMSTIADAPSSTNKLSSNGSSYLLSWRSLNRLNVKTFSAGAWGNTELPESITGNIDTYDVTGTSTGYAFSLRVTSSVSTDLYLLNYNGGTSGTAVLVDAGDFKVSEHAIKFGHNHTWLAWQQFDGIDMQLMWASYQGNNVVSSGDVLSTRNHGAGVTSGKVATTPLGVKVTAWGQTYFDATGTEKTGAFVRVDDGSGTLGNTMLLRNTAGISDVITIGETIVVLLNVVGGLDVMEYSNGQWGTRTSLTSSHVYSWDYKIANGRLMLVWENVNDIRATVYENGSWSAPVFINQSGEGNGSPEVASNGEDFMVSWKEYLPVDPLDALAPTRTINTRFYDASLAQWDDATIIAGYKPVYGGQNPQISSNGDGFMVAWARDDGTDTISLYASICGADGVCNTPGLLENQAISVGHFDIASNGTGYIITYASNAVMGIIHDGNNWGSPVTLGDNGNQSLKVNSNGIGYLAAWYSFEEGTPVYAARYTPGSGWDALASIKTGTTSVGTFSWFQIIPVGIEYTVTWLGYKPDHFYQMKNIYSNTWNGATWTGEQQINTGKFDVASYHYDVVNDALRYSWIQAHESLGDEAATALFEKGQNR